VSKHEFTKAETAQIRKLIRSECCNYDDGNCMVLFDGCERTCPQSISLRLICRWFIEAVLPLDSKLQIALKTAPNIQTSQCELCGKILSVKAIGLSIVTGVRLKSDGKIKPSIWLEKGV